MTAHEITLISILHLIDAVKYEKVRPSLIKDVKGTSKYFTSTYYLST